MRVNGWSYFPIMFAQLAVIASVMLFDLTASVESNSLKSSSAENLQTSSRHKRAPSWGKRNSLNEEILEESENSQELLESVEDLKRSPGWGKRSSELAFDSALAAEKRAPGWGKRSEEFETDDDSMDQEKRAPGWGKRAPGWGKRAPGWGKRAPGWGKRAPGWGKRAPGWGKRAPGWGKRSGNDYCEKLKDVADEYILLSYKIEEQRAAECGGEPPNSQG